MFAAAPSIENVCLPYKHWANAPGNDPVKRAVRAFVQRLNTVLKGRSELVKATDALHDELFALRLRALEHLAATDGLDLLTAMDRVAKGWKEKAQGQAMELMVWNMEFAVDVQRDLLRSLKSQGIALNTDTVATFAPLRDHRFTGSLRLCRPWYPTRRLQRCSPLGCSPLCAWNWRC